MLSLDEKRVDVLSTHITLFSDKDNISMLCDTQNNTFNVTIPTFPSSKSAYNVKTHGVNDLKGSPLRRDQAIIYVSGRLQHGKIPASD